MGRRGALPPSFCLRWHKRRIWALRLALPFPALGAALVYAELALMALRRRYVVWTTSDVLCGMWGKEGPAADVPRIEVPSH
jgi:hypothetical protein